MENIASRARASSVDSDVDSDDKPLISDEEYNNIIIEYAESLEGWSNSFPPKQVYKTLPDATQVRFELGFWQRFFLFLASPRARLFCSASTFAFFIIFPLSVPAHGIGINSYSLWSFSALLAYCLGQLRIIGKVISGITMRFNYCSFRYTPASCPRPECDNDPTFCPNSHICQPVPLVGFSVFEALCNAILTFDLFFRLVLVGSMPTR